MDKITDNFTYFTKEHEEIYKAYSAFGKLIHEKGGPLDSKTRALLKVAMSSVGDNDYVLETHLKKAIESGCTREELEHVVLLTAPSVGFPNMMSSLMVLRRVLD
jgi:alkylhydroperoxidase/carboxymuconolactone decarboxylase family protein YurZ